MPRMLAFAFVAALVMTTTTQPCRAHAQAAVESNTQTAGPRIESQKAPLSNSSSDADVPIETLRRRRFSVGRFFLESVVGTAVGSGAAFGIYKASCGDEPCLVGALGGLFANLAITPLVVFGTGRLAGGNGSVSSAYGGSVVGLAAGGTFAPVSVGLGLLIGTLLMPFTSAVGFELNSQKRANQTLLERHALEPTANVLSSAQGLNGLSLGLRGRL